MKYKRKPEGRFYSPKHGRVMEYKDGKVCIYWSPQMLDYLRTHYSRTMNEELVGCLGVSQSTIIRKARELGLEKDTDWLLSMWHNRLRLATVVLKRKGNPGGIKKGEHRNPHGEYRKGYKPSEEVKAKMAEARKRWWRLHREEMRQKLTQSWERRKKSNTQV